MSGHTCHRFDNVKIVQNVFVPKRSFFASYWATLSRIRRRALFVGVGSLIPKRDRID